MIGYYKINASKKETFFSELQSLLISGVDFSRAFSLLILSQENEKQKDIFQTIYDRIVNGDSLAGALDKSGYFSKLDCGVVRIGEETGQLNETLNFLSSYYQKQIAQKRMLVSALTYPIIILSVALIVVAFMMSVVVPMFEQVYLQMGGELPWLTNQIIAFSTLFSSLIWYIAATIVVCIFLIYHNKDKEWFKKYSAQLAMRLPIFGYAIKQNARANFCKLLYLLTSSGIPLIQSLDLMRDIITFYPYRESFDTIIRGVENGESFSANLGHFPRLYNLRLKTLLMVGEETNRLSFMLKKQGDEITTELEHRLKQLGSMLEPVLIIFVGTIVAIILIGMYLPMFKLGSVM